MSESSVGSVQAIAIRSYKNGPMTELSSVKATAAGGLEGDVDASTQRAVTLISSRQWAQVNRELDADLPWHTRRANILIDADSLGDLRKKTVQIGEVRLKVHAETRPCELMDKLHQGLRAALAPECRGGVFGSVEQAGTIRVGDTVSVVD